MSFSDCYAHAQSLFPLGELSIHGPSHWRRVEKFAIRIAAHTEGADLTVCRLFAIYHDSCRLNEGLDYEHGPLAAEMLKSRFLNLTTAFAFDASRFELLLYAIAHHTTGETSPDPTIGACWDADRLDLGRVGTQPHPRYMSTEYTKNTFFKSRTCQT